MRTPKTPKRRNLILVPLNILSDNALYGHPSATPRGERGSQTEAVDRRRLNNRTYQLLDLDTGEIITQI